MKNITIDPARVARLLSPDVSLRSGSGVGVNGKFDACVMQAVDWLAGGAGETDAPACADPAISRFCIQLNDAAQFAKWRDELKPYAPRIAGTAGTKEHLETRSFTAADFAVRVAAPLAFTFWGETIAAERETAFGLAERLRSLAPIVDKETALAGRDVAREARKATASAASAAYATYAASASAASAYAAEYAASAAYADSAAYTADVASAASAAYAAYAESAEDVRARADALARALWDSALACLDAMIRVTEAVEV